MLNTILHLTPLTLLEVASKSVIREATQWSRMHKVALEQPYWFFQGMRSDGLLKIASPGGQAECITAIDVMNIIPMDPIRVLAMPPSQFRKRSPDRNAPDRYAPASVIGALRSRYGFDYQVLFDDEALRESSSWLAPLAPGERERLLPLTRRTRMPVSSTSSSNWSADGEIKKIERTNKKACSVFFSKALTAPAAGQAARG